MDFSDQYFKIEILKKEKYILYSIRDSFITEEKNDKSHVQKVN